MPRFGLPPPAATAGKGKRGGISGEDEDRDETSRPMGVGEGSNPNPLYRSAASAAQPVPGQALPGAAHRPRRAGCQPAAPGAQPVGWPAPTASRAHRRSSGRSGSRRGPRCRRSASAGASRGAPSQPVRPAQGVAGPAAHRLTWGSDLDPARRRRVNALAAVQGRPLRTEALPFGYHRMCSGPAALLAARAYEGSGVCSASAACFSTPSPRLTSEPCGGPLGLAW